MREPLVTVFIPVYNREKFIYNSINSILNQTYKNIEVIIIDDNSNDNTLNIIKSFKDDRIKIIENTENKGIPYNRNKGLELANGKYLVIMDSDDISHRIRIEKQVAFLEENHDVDVVASNYILFGKKFNRKVKLRYSTPQEIKIALLFGNPIANPTTAIRLSTLKKYNISYNEDFFVAQDYELWSRVSLIGNFSVLQDFLLKYRIGHENVTLKSKQQKENERKRLIDNIHTNLISLYGIDLSSDELNIFNNFFAEVPTAPTNALKLTNVISKIEKEIQQRRIFNKVLFRKVLHNAIVQAISNLKASIVTKIILYRKTKRIDKFSGMFIDICKIALKTILRG